MIESVKIRDFLSHKDTMITLGIIHLYLLETMELVNQAWLMPSRLHFLVNILERTTRV